MTPRVHRDDDSCSREIERGDPDQDAYAFLRKTVAEAQEAGAFRDEFEDPDLVSQVVWSSVHGVASLYLILGQDSWVQWRSPEEVASTATEVMIRGLVRPGMGESAKARGRHG
jgi:hypothetical protein